MDGAKVFSSGKNSANPLPCAILERYIISERGNFIFLVRDIRRGNSSMEMACSLGEEGED